MSPSFSVLSLQNRSYKKPPLYDKLFLGYFASYQHALPCLLVLASYKQLIKSRLHVSHINQLRGKFPTVIVNRAILFFFFICLLTGFFYILGTVQGFMDDTLYLLLRIGAVFGILLTVSSVLGFFIDLGFLLAKKKIRYLGVMFFYCFLGIFGGTIVYASYFIMVISAG
jgi:hypothetical protein